MDARQRSLHTGASIRGVMKLLLAACVPVEKIPHGRKSRYDGISQRPGQPGVGNCDSCSPATRRGFVRQPARNSFQRRERESFLPQHAIRVFQCLHAGCEHAPRACYRTHCNSTGD